MNGRHVTVSTDRVKPANIVMETDDRTVTTWAPPEQTTQPTPKPSPLAMLTSRSGRHVRSRRVTTFKHILREGVMWGHPSLSTPIFRAQLGTHKNIRKRPSLRP